MNKVSLELKDISKSYGALRATHKLSLSVNTGEIHALIGPNGAGKTTLIKQIYGSEQPDSGQILLNGELINCLLYTSPSPRDRQKSRMPSSS